MAIFGRLLGKSDSDSEPGDEIECPHTVLVARWDDLDAMGHEDQASHFECVSCNEQFSPAQAQEIRRAASECIREVVDV